jgi:hypothetical protein
MWWEDHEWEIRKCRSKMKIILWRSSAMIGKRDIAIVKR